MQMLGELPVGTVLLHTIFDLADIVMGTDEDEVVGIGEEAPDRLHFSAGRCLIGPERIEADDDDGIDMLDQRIIEERPHAIIALTLDLDDGIACQFLGQRGEGREIGLLDVIQEAGDALIDVRAVRQRLELGVE